MVEEWSSAFDRVGHFAAVAEVREQQVLEVGFCEEILGCVERVPLRVDTFEHCAVDTFCVGEEGVDFVVGWHSFRRG